MQDFNQFLIDYWYFGLLIIIVVWELLRLVLKLLLKRFIQPIKTITAKLFGNPKLVNLELLVVLAIAVGVIIYLLITK